jgi:carboxylesterase
VAIHLGFKFGEGVAGIVAFAPTLFYDGWAVHKGKVLLPLVWHIPFFRNRIDIREGWPYGLKDETLRRHIENFYTSAKTAETNEKVLAFGSPFFPLTSLYQLNQFAALVKKEMPAVKNPILILHAKDDDMTSIKNSEYVFNHIGSKDKSLIVLENSYHMITIDNERARVAEETVGFLDRLSAS